MNIRIHGIDERFKYQLDHIAALFFEEVVVEFVTSENPDVDITITLTGDKEIHVTAELTELATGRSFTAEHEKNSGPSADEKARLKQEKHAVSYVFLSVLQQLTGIEQPWGTLTGVRPTKLFHNRVKEGVPTSEIRKHLKEDFMIDAEKVDLMEQIVERQRAVVPDLYDLSREVSIYIGIPYCPTKCAYCTFPAYAIQGKQGDVNSFLTGLHYEIREIGRWMSEKGIKITTIYFGGGTPTSITAEEMDALYEELYHSFPNVENVREITVEAGRPDTITPKKIDVLKKWSIDRISINPQSYIQETLKAIGRHHTVEETVEKFHLARNMGMNNINMDLIIGLPGEGLPEFKHTLAETKKLLPESLTVHTLSFKRASEMTKNKEKYKVAGREEIKAMMDAASSWTKENGYAPYYLYRQKNILGNLENVGYAFPGQESIYNIMIMEEVQSIIGLGCGASSKFVHPTTGKITRYANPKEPRVYNLSFKEYTDEKLKMLDELFADPEEAVQK